ncbi:adenosylcobinamide amidohydrolase [Haloprofundus salilacus]|uniref:adenosylcobinamide amidohydrolase n=1 Tax=Haloprofundus salilacus TaxID=2876190 RepID=UPI001CCE3966|nr:adenosylcobinamide amidohydrolase [Haloprofundus salilacus]
MSEEAAEAAAVFEATVRDGVCRLRRPGTRWLSTGYAGGTSVGPVAYNVTVPDGWSETDLDVYVRERRERAGFDEPGPTLLTGVEQGHARRARLGPVEAVVTAGVSNPAALPTDALSESGRTADERHDRDAPPHPGTINVFVGTTRALAAGALPNLLAVAAEAKAATLLARTGFPGTTTDAVVVSCDPNGEVERFSGSATTVGAAARACVRDAVCASLASRYADPDGRPMPDSVGDAKYGVVTDERARVSRL